MKEGAALVDSTPVQIEPKGRSPKKIRDVRPVYPNLPAGTTGSGPWIGEFLLNERGRVAEVWTVRPIRFTPTFPAFNQAIVSALRQWEFEPFIVDGHPAPVCTSVTILINWS